MSAADRCDGREATTARATAILFALLCLAITALGVHDLLVPAYADAEIRASFVDTWEPAAMFTTVVLAALALIGAALLTLFVTAGRRARGLALAAFVSCVVAIAVSLAAHIALTERVTALTGQEFGRFWGLL